MHDRADDPRVLEPLGDRRQRRFGGEQILEVQDVVLACGGGNDAHGHVPGVLRGLGRDAPHPRHLGRRLACQQLEVLRRHRPAAGAQHQRAAHTGLVDRLGIDATGRRMAVGHTADERDRRLERADRAPRDVAAVATADGVVANADRRDCAGGIAPYERIEPSSSRTSGANSSLARGGIEDHDLVARTAVGERVDQRPLLPALVGADLDDGV